MTQVATTSSSAPSAAPPLAAPLLPYAPRTKAPSGMFRRLVIWLLLFAAWEGAYRIIGWRAWKFPAPSHVVDATLNLLNVHTAFGDALHAGWPRHGGAADAAER